MKTYIGIDNGLDGGIAWIQGSRIETIPMPTVPKGKGRVIYLAGLRGILINLADPFTILIEEPEPHAPSARGLASLWYNYGKLESLCTISELPWQPVKCRIWQSTFWRRPKMAKGEKFNTKAAALQAAERIWPRHDFRRTEKSLKPHDGMIDAALIAEFGRRMNL